MRAVHDDWLARCVEYPVFNVVVEDTDDVDTCESELSRLTERISGKAFLHCKVSADRVKQVSALERAGFSVVDVNVVFERPATPISHRVAAECVVVPSVPAIDFPSVLDLAQSSFSYSRFHLDPLIPNEVADHINRAWIEDYTEGRRGERLIGAYVDDRLVGFNAILRTERLGRSVLVIDLIGVAPEYRGRQIGARLVEEFIHLSHASCDRMRVGTQVANLPAVRLYERYGFKLSEARYVLHAHVSGRDGAKPGLTKLCPG